MFSDYIDKLLLSTKYGSSEKAYQSLKSWIGPESTLYVDNPELYNDCLEKIYNFNKKISSRFSRKTIFEHINKQMPKLKKSESSNVVFENFFEDILAIKPKNLTITSPISGVRLNGDVRHFSLRSYKFGYLEDLIIPIANESGLYISVDIKDVYDQNIAISKAENAFLDFSRIIVFMSGKQDRSILIKTGLPLMPSYNHEFMYVQTSSYQVTDEFGNLDSSSISNKNLEKVPLNNNFFCKNESFDKLWELNEKRINGSKLKDIEARVINAAIALGESALTSDKKNSIIYTCISLEIMFSHDERGLFQRSIGEIISDLFTFVVAKNKESRLEMKKVVKKIYGMRSAIVHGGNKELTGENLVINVFMRVALSEMLNNEKYQEIKCIEDLNQMLKEAQNSY